MEKKASYHHESSLLSDFKSGDVNAFRVIHDSYYRALWFFAFGILKDSEQAEDFVSESFVVLWQKRENFENLKSVYNFLYTVIRNRCFTYLSVTKKKKAANQDLTYLATNADHSFISEEIRAELIRLSLEEARNMPPQMKKVFEMIYVEGLKNQEAAEKMGLSVHTIKAQRAKAIIKVRAALGKKGLLGLLFSFLIAF